MSKIDPVDRIRALAADIVSAHIGANDVKAAEVPALLRGVYATLAQLTATTSPLAMAPHTHDHNHDHDHDCDHDDDAKPVRAPTPRVVNTSNDDLLVCLEDGLSMKMLKRHLQTVHGLTPAQYRTKWGLPDDAPMVAPTYATLRSKLAKDSGLGRRAQDRSWHSR